MLQDLANSSLAQVRSSEERQNDNDTANDATDANEQVSSNYYDPAQYQNYFYQDEDGNYYYQDADGNYYYYADNPDQRGVDGEATGESVQISPVPGQDESRAREIEIDNWQPESTYCFVDFITNLFLCAPFRLYLSVMILCGIVLLLMIGLDCTFASLYRIFVTPNTNKNIGMQVLAYFCVFIQLSFISVSVICLGMDLVRALWLQRRKDVSIWCMSHTRLTKQLPPFIFYCAILLVTLVIPLLWAVIETLAVSQSFVFVAQRFSNLCVLSTVCMIAVLYVWFYFQALMHKCRAIRDAHTHDDDDARRKGRHEGNRERLKNAPLHWYHEHSILEEFGLDSPTLQYNSLVFTLSGLPIFAVLAGQRMSTYEADPSIEWALIACAVMMCVYIISWVSLLHTMWYWAIYISFFLILLFVTLGAIGGVIANPTVFGVLIVLFVLSHGLVARKRQHRLTARQLASELPYAPARQSTEEERKSAAHRDAHAAATAVDTSRREDREVHGSGGTYVPGGDGGVWQAQRYTDIKELPAAPYDSYLFCCRDVLFGCLCCIDVKRYFGHVHPEVRKAQRKYNNTHLGLRTDQKVLCVWWLVVMFAVAFVVALGNGLSYRFDSLIAVMHEQSDANFRETHARREPAIIVAASTSADLCSARFNTRSATPLTMYDVALLAALSYTYGSNGNTDFNTWFAAYPTLVRSYPMRLPATLNGATDGTSIPYSVYLDINTNFKVVTLNANTRGMSIFRDMDDWGTSIALQVASVLSPLISIWPVRYRAAFVHTVSKFKGWLSYPDTLGEVKAYLDGVIAAEGNLASVLLVGDSFNGGYVKMLASRFDVMFVVFNAPGVRFITPGIASGQRPLLSGYQITNIRGLWSHIDSLEDTQNSVFLACPASSSSNQCSRITTTLLNLHELCGDLHGRQIHFNTRQESKKH